MKKTLVLMLVVLITAVFVFGCSSAVDTPPGAVYEDGVWEGTGEGFKDDIVVEVTIKDGVITAIEVISHSETEALSDPAFEEVPDAIIVRQSTEGVDTVSGATGTSEGILAAVADALAKATP